jgi:hypothetical protein
MGDVWICDVNGLPETRAGLDSWKVDGWPEGWASVCVGDEDGAEHFLIVPWNRLLHAADVEAAEAARPQYGRA